MAGKQKDIQSKTLLSVQRNENQERGNAIEIRVVDWIVEGKHYPQLEKREFFTDQSTGDWKMGKAKGFTVKDLIVVQDQWGEIMEALGGKPAEKKPASAPAAAPASAPASQQQEDF